MTALEPAEDGFSPVTQEALVGEGVEAEVYRLSDSGRALKRYRDSTNVEARAREEARVLGVLEDASESIPAGVRFPRLFASRPGVGEIEMELAAGVTLSSAPPHNSVQEVGRLIGHGISAYTRLVGRAYNDLAPDNIMWDAKKGEIWMLDVAGGDRLIDPVSPGLRASVSVGYYLGSVAYEAARPGFRLIRARTHARLCAQATRTLRELGTDDSRLWMIRSAWARFSASSRSGGTFRKLYYRTLGGAIAVFVILGFGLLTALSGGGRDA